VTYYVFFSGKISSSILDNITAYHVLMLLVIQNTYSSLQHCEILLEEAVSEWNGDNVDIFIELVCENQRILRQRKVCV
jgi:hypothetical protein